MWQSRSRTKPQALREQMEHLPKAQFEIPTDLTAFERFVITIGSFPTPTATLVWSPDH